MNSSSEIDSWAALLFAKRLLMHGKFASKNLNGNFMPQFTFLSHD